MGIIYDKGMFGRVDKQMAKYWYSKAAKPKGG